MTASYDDFNRDIVEEFRANAGIVRRFERRDTSILLLHTTGAKSGQPRMTPLGYLAGDGKMLIIGSYGGAPKHPAWVHNVRANPRARIEVGTDEYDVDVRELPDAERDAAIPKVVEFAPAFAHFQANLTRTIPLFELNPRPRLSDVGAVANRRTASVNS